MIEHKMNELQVPPAAKNLFEKRFLDLQKLLSIFLVGALFLILPSCSKKDEEVTPGEAQQEIAEWMPELVPYLDSKPSAVDGQGKAVIKPKGPFPADSRADFEITFTVGKAGIKPGGYIILQIPLWWGWSRPQDINREGEGFIAVTTSFDDPGLKVKILRMNRVLVFSRKKRIKPGVRITFKYLHATVDLMAEAEERFMIFVDADGDGHSACIAEPPVIETVAHEPRRLLANAPSQAEPGETIKISVAPLDGLGNHSRFPAGSFTLTVTQDGKETTKKNKKTTGNEKTIAFEYTLPDEGIYFFNVKKEEKEKDTESSETVENKEDEEDRENVNGPVPLAGRSNVTLCQKGSPSLKLYFGDIHGHSGLSDGTGTPEDYYDFARDVSGLDIAALTDHADHGTIRLEGKVWERIKAVANKMYMPGHFVTFVAFEWTNWTYGHRNVYYRDGDGPVFRSFDPPTDTPRELWEKISSYEAMTIAHHVGGGPVPIDWSIPPGEKEWLVEIASIHGSSEYYGCKSGIYHPQEGHFVRDALALGYKLGIMASGDTHDGHPGRRSINAPITGIMGVYATELTREAVWEAFRKRRVYGTSGPKIILNFRVCDSPMGSEVEWPVSKGPVSIAFRAICCDNVDRIEIIRNGVPVFIDKGEGVYVQFLIEDPEPPDGTSWYYARVIQKDGNMAWSSPVWVTVPKK
jgi:hypothetical protein